jgi:hypothetical protein
MRVETWLYDSVDLANAVVLVPRDAVAAAQGPEGNLGAPANYEMPWKPKGKKAEFFSIKFDDDLGDELEGGRCQFDGFAIRLDGGIVIAEEYNKWYDDKLPIFFVDDDTQAYTVSRALFHANRNRVPGIIVTSPRRSARSPCSSTSI